MLPEGLSVVRLKLYHKLVPGGEWSALTRLHTWIRLSRLILVLRPRFLNSWYAVHTISLLVHGAFVVIVKIIYLYRAFGVTAWLSLRRRIEPGFN